MSQVPERRVMVHEFASYLRACYGDRPIHPTQLGEVRQAFMAGGLVALRQVLEAAKKSEAEATVAIHQLFAELEHEGRPR